MNKCRKTKNTFKKLKKVKRQKKNPPQNCRNPTQRQRFITTIKNVIEGGKKAQNLISFHNANEINNYSRGGEKGEKNIQKNIENKSKHKNNKGFY